jgi:hypothetical protein
VAAKLSVDLSYSIQTRDLNFNYQRLEFALELNKYQSPYHMQHRFKAGTSFELAESKPKQTEGHMVEEG